MGGSGLNIGWQGVGLTPALGGWGLGVGFGFWRGGSMGKAGSLWAVVECRNGERWHEVEAPQCPTASPPMSPHTSMNANCFGFQITFVGIFLTPSFDLFGVRPRLGGPRTSPQNKKTSSFSGTNILLGASFFYDFFQSHYFDVLHDGCV